MPASIVRKMPSFEGVAPGQTATLKVPVGMTIHQLLVNYSGTLVALSHFTEIRVIANGRTIQRYTGAEVVDSINQFDGRNAAAGILTLDFERFGLRTRQGEEFTALVTNDGKNKVVSTLVVEVEIAAGAPADVALSAIASQSGPRPVGPVKHVRVFGHDPSAAGDYEVADLPKMRGAVINRVHFKTAATINSIKLERDGFIVSERTTAENEAIQSDGVRVPQSGYYTLDFTEKGNGADGLDLTGVQDLRFTLNMAGAGHVDVIVEYLAALNA